MPPPRLCRPEEDPGSLFAATKSPPRCSFCHRCKNFPVLLANCRFSRYAVLAYAPLCCSGEGSLLPFRGRVEREKKVMEPENPLPSFRHSHRGGGLTHAAAPAGGGERKSAEFRHKSFRGVAPFPPSSTAPSSPQRNELPPEKRFFPLTHAPRLLPF